MHTGAHDNRLLHDPRATPGSHDNVIKWKHFPRYWPLCAGNSPVTGEFPSQRPVTRSFDVFFDLRLNKRLCKQSWGWWFETQSRSLCRQCNAAIFAESYDRWYFSISDFDVCLGSVFYISIVSRAYAIWGLNPRPLSLIKSYVSNVPIVVMPPPPPPTHTHTHTHIHTHTHHSRPKRISRSYPFPLKKGVFFSMACANSIKRGHFAGTGPRNFEKG